MKICLICKNEISADSRATKYCSAFCRARVKYERYRAWIKENPDKAKAYSRKFYYQNQEQILKGKRDSYYQKALEKIEQELRLDSAQA